MLLFSSFLLIFIYSFRQHFDLLNLQIITLASESLLLQIRFELTLMRSE